MGRRYLAWCLIWLIPVVPVVVLYVLFEQYNVFEFQDAPGGLKAVGPIGAYLVLVWLAFRNRHLLDVGLGDEERQLIGSWELNARSRNGHEAKGECRVTEEGDLLCLAGTFAGSAGLLTSTWRSTMAQLDGSQLLVVYQLNDLENDLRSEGLMKLVLEASERPARMVGDWAVIGRQGSMGTIELTRKTPRVRTGPTEER